jgi:hypothetical protein
MWTTLYKDKKDHCGNMHRQNDLYVYAAEKTYRYRASFWRAALLVSSLSPAETLKVLHRLAALSHDLNHLAY